MLVKLYTPLPDSWLLSDSSRLKLYTPSPDPTYCLIVPDSNYIIPYPIPDYCLIVLDLITKTSTWLHHYNWLSGRFTMIGRSVKLFSSVMKTLHAASSIPSKQLHHNKWALAHTTLLHLTLKHLWLLFTHNEHVPT